MRMIDRMLRKARRLRGMDYEEEWQRWQGRYYDELTDAERDAYLDYVTLGKPDRTAFEEVHLMVCDTLHFELTKRPTPPKNQQELNERVKEVEALVLEKRGAAT